MTEYVINPERGEVAIVLDGATYPMRPSHEAALMIEQQLGALLALSYRHAHPMKGLTNHEVAVIVTEAIRAAGRERGEDGAMLRKVATAKISELVYTAGIWSLHPVIDELLANFLRGGSKRTEKKDEAAAQPSPSTGDSPTA